MDKPIEIDGKMYRAVPVMREPGGNPCKGCVAEWRAGDDHYHGMALCRQLPDCGPHYGRGHVYVFEEVKEKP